MKNCIKKIFMNGLSIGLLSFSILPFSPLKVHGEVVDSASSVQIHVLTLDNQNTDAILLESIDADGTKHFGMIDAGEDWDYPKADGDTTRYPLRPGTTTNIGFDEEVISFLMNRGVTPDNFEFFLGTHPHSDHIGNADYVIRTFRPKTVYLQEYQDSYITSEARRWDNLYVYDQAVTAAQEVGAQLIQYFENPNNPGEDNMPKLMADFATYADVIYPIPPNVPTFVEKTPENTGSSIFNLGEYMQIQVLNYGNDTYPVYDANNFSLSVKVSAFGRSALITGDTNNYSDNPYDINDRNGGGFDEDKLMASGLINDLDIYKLAHHGHGGSNSKTLMDVVNPSYVVQTGFYRNLTSDMVNYLNLVNPSTIFSTSTYYKDVEAITFKIDNQGSITNNLPEKQAVLSNGFTTTYYKSGVATEHQGLLTITNGDSTETYYFPTLSTSPVTHNWLDTNKGWVYFGADGKMLTNSWIELTGKWYYLQADGVAATGWNNIEGVDYYFNKAGDRALGWTKIDNNWYYFSGNGHYATGEQFIGDKFYKFGDNGVMYTGWLKKGDSWLLFLNSGELATNWTKHNNKWYYMNSDGIMQTGWVKVDNTWYHLSDSGAMTTGWKQLKAKWYYLDKSSGAMKTDWLKDNNKWYYLDSSGAMKTGWQRVTNTWYHLQSSGMMSTGWVKDAGKWYYTNPSGAMQVGWLKDKNKWYYLETSGAMKTGWLMENRQWYFLGYDGAMVTGTLKIDRKTYRFRSNGTLIS